MTSLNVMKKKIIIILLIIYSSSFFLLAQNKKNKKNEKLNEKVYGYVVNNNKMYLVTDNGFLNVYSNKITNKQWGDYYRKIYNDSTIVNPNTVIETNAGSAFLNYFIPINISDWIQQKYSFKNDMYLYDFIRVDSNGNYRYRPGILNIIADYKKDNKLVLPKKFNK